MSKLRPICAAAALAATASGAALAETTASVGIMSDYIWRGIYTSDASAFASIDVTGDSGVYFGMWGADVQNGLEYDVYFGYAGGTENFQWNVGVTGYYFTDEAYDTLEEFNIGFSYGFLDVQYALGDYDNPAGFYTATNVDADEDGMFDDTVVRSRDQTYEYLIATFTPEVGPYYLIGRGDYQNIRSVDGATGMKGMWVEIGKDFEIMEGLEIGISVLYTPDALDSDDATWQVNGIDQNGHSVFLSGTNPFAEYAMVMHLTKTIGIGD